MLSFSKKYHEAIKAGNITMSFRDWKTLNVQKNKIYKSCNLGLLKVIDVSFRKLADISLNEIKKSGFRSFHDFRDSFEESARRTVDFKTESAVKIEFEYLGDEIENKKRLMGKVTPMELFEIKQNLLSLDGQGGCLWVVKTLQALEEKGPLRIEDLEKTLKMTPDTVKMNMRKLRGLSLITSSSKRGYSITPLSLKILGILRKK
ncbi:MAG: hypothetical protein EHM54_06000 [Nitrospiraceae bacterium]|jgi:hypothetical protein|nr:MAG: hypothetical protein EHM54_06000 [Nitrospiraceae bacterium]